MRSTWNTYAPILVLLGSIGLAPAHAATFGVNLSGAEFNESGASASCQPPGARCGDPGRFGTDYTYPTAEEIAYYMDKGLSLFRVPFLLERFYPYGPSLVPYLSKDEVGHMNAFLSMADAAGAQVILDMHDYMNYWQGQIGGSALSRKRFAAEWGRLVKAFGHHRSVYAWDPMNEPQGNTTAYWSTLLQAVITAIRATGDTHIIIAPGNNWSGSQTWISDGNAPTVTDPLNNIVYEAHSYWDDNNSGTYDSCTTLAACQAAYANIGSNPNAGVTDLQPFLDWCTTKNVKCMVGEMGVPANIDPTDWLPVLSNALAAIAANPNVVLVTMWGGGPWWGNLYPQALDPIGPWPNCGGSPLCSGTDSPAMTIIENY